MRSIQKSIAIIFLMVVFSCSNDDALLTNETKVVSNLKAAQGSTVTYSNDELVIQYKPGTSDSVKNMLRQFYNVFSYEVCHRCPDESIEKWFFTDSIGIEPRKQSMEAEIDDEDIEGILEVDYEFTFTEDEDLPTIGGATDFGYEPYIKAANSGITIAIIDSGIDTNLPSFNEGTSVNEFLYRAPASDEGLSGWDFVNYDHNPFDNNNAKHGTMIAEMIYSEIKDTIAHQILPFKVSNNIGEIKYFALVCALNDALNKADVVQMSLGWYDDGFGDFTNTIFSNLLDAHSDVIVVTSAGNAGTDNDIDKHYPSSYSQNNVIAVAAVNTNLTSIAWFSNYGSTSVDFFAPGEHIYFEGYYMDGTSFAAPVVTTKVVKIISEAPTEIEVTPDYILGKLFLSGTTFSVTGKPTKYNKLITP